MTSRPPEEIGCLYYSPRDQRFVLPLAEATLAAQDARVYYGAPGGMLPRMAEQRIEVPGEPHAA